MLRGCRKDGVSVSTPPDTLGSDQLGSGGCNLPSPLGPTLGIGKSYGRRRRYLSLTTNENPYNSPGYKIYTSWNLYTLKDLFTVGRVQYIYLTFLKNFLSLPCPDNREQCYGKPTPSHLTMPDLHQTVKLKVFVSSKSFVKLD